MLLHMDSKATVWNNVSPIKLTNTEKLDNVYR